MRNFTCGLYGLASGDDNGDVDDDDDDTSTIYVSPVAELSLLLDRRLLLIAVDWYVPYSYILSGLIGKKEAMLHITRQLAVFV